MLLHFSECSVHSTFHLSVFPVHKELYFPLIAAHLEFHFFCHSSPISSHFFLESTISFTIFSGVSFSKKFAVCTTGKVIDFCSAGIFILPDSPLIFISIPAPISFGPAGVRLRV